MDTQNLPDAKRPRFPFGIITLVITLALPSCTWLRSLIPFEAKPLPSLPIPTTPLPEPAGDAGVIETPVWLDGRLLRAASVAIQDLVSRRSRELAQYERPHHPLSVCLTQPETYDAQVVNDDGGRYIIYVRPRGERCGPDGEGLKGGDATYEIAKSDFRIISGVLGE